MYGNTTIIFHMNRCMGISYVWGFTPQRISDEQLKRKSDEFVYETESNSSPNIFTCNENNDNTQ